MWKSIDLTLLSLNENRAAISFTESKYQYRRTNTFRISGFWRRRKSLISFDTSSGVLSGGNLLSGTISSSSVRDMAAFEERFSAVLYSSLFRAVFPAILQTKAFRFPGVVCGILFQTDSSVSFTHCSASSVFPRMLYAIE